MAPSFRPWTDADRDACLAVFRSNVPTFFAAHEEAEFDAFLRSLPGPYFVLLDDGRVVACGGYALGPHPGTAALCWGMVTRDRHGRGHGRALTEQRIDALRQEPGVTRVTIETSQHTTAFFARFGFVEESREPDGFAPGIDRVKMTMRIG